MRDVKLDFNDILLVPQFSDLSSRKEVVLKTTIEGEHGAKLQGIPIIAANMDGVGTFEMNTELSKYELFTAIRKSYTAEDWFTYADDMAKQGHTDFFKHTFITVGMSDVDIHKLRLLNASLLFGHSLHINVDVANGYMRKFHEYVKSLREEFPESFIIAGTVCTPEGVGKLRDCGADLVRVGIGSGAACLTRQIAGVGYPQFSAVEECSMEGEIVSDGGCVYPGDFAKAFAAGATMVMAGGIFAGHTEGGGEIDSEGYMTFYGMSSSTAHPPIELNGQLDYRASEGRILKIPHKGPVKNTVRNILGGLRSACTYVGAFTLDELTSIVYIQVNRQLNSSLEHHTIGT